MIIYWSEACDVVRFKFLVSPHEVDYKGDENREHIWMINEKRVMVKLPEDLERIVERRNGRYYEWLGYKTRAIYWRKLESSEKMETDWDNWMDEDIENDEYKIIDLGRPESVN